jgi:hypothetical protein
MRHIERSARGFFLLGLIVLASACREPREGFYDRDQHRWYHEHHRTIARNATSTAGSRFCTQCAGGHVI